MTHLGMHVRVAVHCEDCLAPLDKQSKGPLSVIKLGASLLSVFYLGRKVGQHIAKLGSVHTQRAQLLPKPHHNKGGPDDNRAIVDE